MAEDPRVRPEDGGITMGITLQNVAVSLLHDHLRRCVIDAVRLSPEEGSHKLEEANSALARLVHS